LLAGAALGGCASAPPPQVIYVERPYAPPPPRVMMPPHWHGAECGPPAYAVRAPRGPVPPGLRRPHGPKSAPRHHGVPARRRAHRIDHGRDSAHR